MNYEEYKQKLKLIEMPHSSSAHKFWIQARKDLKVWLLNHDWNNFRECPIIKQTMDVGQAEYSLLELQELCDNKVFERYRPHMHWHTEGNKQVYKGNSIHHCYHLYQWEKHSGRKVEELDSILEFGAGFGETCRIIHELGFKGKYKIIDFPELCLLQEFYLKSNGVDCSNVTWSHKISGVDCSTYYDLFISEWSLSECLDKDREPALHIKYENILIAYSIGKFMNIENMDNEEFFSQFPKFAYHGDKMNWDKYNTIHEDKRHKYLIGWL